MSRKNGPILVVGHINILGENTIWHRSLPHQQGKVEVIRRIRQEVDIQANGDELDRAIWPELFKGE